MPSRMRERFFDTAGLTMKEAEAFGTDFARTQRDIMFWIADLANYAAATWPDSHHQIWPEWVSPGLIQRAAGVGRAYSNERDRTHACTYSQYMQVAGKDDRHTLLDTIEADGLTTDESRKTLSESPKARWLLAVDVSYHLHRHWFSGAGVEAATRVTQWLQRTVARLKEKGLTDVACCFESPRNFRKELTKDWEDRYKDRPPKDMELRQQIQLVGELLHGAGFRCVSVDGFESDDLLASYAAQFPGRITILSQDKDMRQCLSEKCNMLMDVEWIEDETSGEPVPQYKWLSAKQHTDATGIRPEQWAERQALMGDACDGIKGAPGIGDTGSTALIKSFGSASAAIQAAKDSDEGLLSMPRGKITAKGLLEFEPKLQITMQLVTLCRDCSIPFDTRIA